MLVLKPPHRGQAHSCLSPWSVSWVRRSDVRSGTQEGDEKKFTQVTVRMRRINTEEEDLAHWHVRMGSMPQCIHLSDGLSKPLLSEKGVTMQHPHTHTHMCPCIHTYHNPLSVSHPLGSICCLKPSRGKDYYLWRCAVYTGMRWWV